MSSKLLLNGQKSYSFSAPSLLRTPSVVLGESKAELHVLAGASQFWNCLLALKSLLRFVRHISIAIHSDGTITDEHAEIFRKHFPGVRLISRQVADKLVGTALKDFPSCREFRSKNVVMSQVFDFLILSRTERVIAMDSDVIFFDWPEEVIDWINNDKMRSLFTFEPLPFCPRIERLYITQLYSHGFKFAPHLCGGFICMFRELLNLPLLEKYCEYVKANCTDRLYRAQTMNALLLAQRDWMILPASYQNFSEFINDPSPVMRHYWLSNMDGPNWTSYIAEANRILRELSTSRISAALRKFKRLSRERYEFHGLAGDGWMSPYGIIRVVDPATKILKLTLEIPAWMPFKFPVFIKAIQNERQIAILEVTAPGIHTLSVPLTASGIIELCADQWFIPAELGVSVDKRQLCYRVLDPTLKGLTE